MTTKNKVKEIVAFVEYNLDYIILNEFYTDFGFSLESHISPNYYYTNGHGKRLNKYTFKKQFFNKNYETNSTTKEVDVAKQLGYYRIWDCGVIKYVYKNPNYLL